MQYNSLYLTNLFFLVELDRLYDTYIDVGLFTTGDVTAKYTLSGATANESYSANGVDVSAVIKENEKEGYFVKGGFHSSTIDGNADVTINGTTYAAQATASGTGFLIGGGFDFDGGQRAGATFYSNLGMGLQALLIKWRPKHD